MNRRTQNLDQLTIAANQKPKEREYWLQKLAGNLPRSMFPYDSEPATAPSDLSLAELEFTPAPSLTAQILKLSANSETRLHMVLVTGLIGLLARYSGHTDIIMGTPIFGTTRETTGAMLNTVVPLRGQITTTTTFKELVLQVKDTVMAAAQNQSYPIEILARQLNLDCSGADFPLFAVALALENIQNPLHLDAVTPPIIFSFKLIDPLLLGRVLYDSRRYSHTYIQQISGHWLEFMQKSLAELDKPLLDIDILSPTEHQKLWLDMNGPEMAYPSPATIAELVEVQVVKHPQQIAVICGSGQLTYQQLNQQANQLAHLLRHKGVVPNSVIAVLMERSLDLAVTLLAIIKAGGAYLPIDPDYPENRIRTILEESDTCMLITASGVIHPLSFSRLQNRQSTSHVAEPHLILTPSRAQICDFDSLPLPDRTLVDYSTYHQCIGIAPVKRTMALQTSRGCPYNCLYCHKIWPKKHVVRSAGNIYQEIRQGYEAGIRDFVFIDDIFNLDKVNSGKLLETIIRDNLNVRLYYPNGLRADVLDKEFIDLMAAAGTVNIDVALESACPRIQKLMKKNLNLEKFRENLLYIAHTYPQIILEMEMMHGFPTETEAEAMMTFEFLKSIHWIHFPNLNILKIFPNTDMYRLAIEHGVSPQAIENSTNFAYHELPGTLPWPKQFTRRVQAQLLQEYFLLKERMLAVLPQQMKIMTQDELVKKYDTYLPMPIRQFSDILDAAGILPEELGVSQFHQENQVVAPLDFSQQMRAYFPLKEAAPDACRVLLLDLSHFFSTETGTMLYNVTEAPLGLMYLLTFLNQKLGASVAGKIYKSRIDFDDYDALKRLILDFKPHLIGIRSLSYYREFFHRTVTVIKEWGIEAPIISGGPYATSDYPILLQDPHVRLAVLGEGEHTFLELVERMIANGNKLPDEEELKQMAGIVLVSEVERDHLLATQRKILLLDIMREEVAGYPTTDLEKINCATDLLYLISTSGSTGKPKLVKMAHCNLVNLLFFQHSQTNINFERVLQFASIAFDVSFQEIFTTLTAGGTIHFLTPEVRSNIPLLLEFIAYHRIETLFFPPAFLKFIFDQPEYVQQFPTCVRHIVTAGEQLLVTPSMRRYFQEHQVYLHNHYGPAETHVVTTFTMGPGNSYPDLPPIGKPIANTTIFILDNYLNPQPCRLAGELYIAGAAVGLGYHNQAELTSEKFLNIERFGKSRNPFTKGLGDAVPFLATGGNRVYRTGDLACWLPDGNIQFLGRKDQQVQVRGFRIELEEIRGRLLQLDSVKDAVIVDRRTASGDVYLCAYIVPVTMAVEFEVSGVRESLALDLPDYMVPSFFIPMEKLPLNSSGKIDRKALPEPRISASGVAGEPPMDETQKRVARIWAEVLEGSVGIDDNFFEMGGHSLKGTVLISRLHREFNVKLMLVDVFKYPTIRLLSRFLDTAVQAVDSFQAISPAPQMEYYPLSSAQKRLYILQQMDKQITTYNMPMAVTVSGVLDKPRLLAVFQQLIARHESVRTRFITHEKRTVQQILEAVDFQIQEIQSDSASITAFIQPFDLAHAPLLRVAVSHIDANQYLLMMDIHHIISDAVTLEIIIAEFAALYDNQSLPPLRLQYRDYSYWQNTLLETGAMARQEKFWLERFAGTLPQLNMPTDFPRPERKGSAGDSRVVFVFPQLGERVHQLARQKETTLYQFLLAIYIILLHKYSGQSDIIVGSPVSGRPHIDLQPIVGVFVNMVAIRTRPLPDKTFSEFLEEVKNGALAAHENQEYPFDDLVNKLGLQGTAGRNPIFDVGFLYNALDTRKINQSSLQITPYQNTNPVSRFDMLMAASQGEKGIMLSIEFSTELFRPASIEAFLNHYLEILEQVTNDSTLPLDKITITGNLKAIVAEKPEITFGF